MAALGYYEKRALEKAFQMESGVVLDFTDRTFSEFVHYSVGREIHSEKYTVNGRSKAKKLRVFVQVEPDHVVGKLLADLVSHADMQAEISEDRVQALEMCQRLAERLRQSAPVLDEVPFESSEATFQKVADAVRDAIQRNDPEGGLDRLHTYFIWFVRQACKDNGIEVDKDDAANAVMGKYVKHLKATKRIESEMTLQILNYAQATISHFNRVRNEQSLAHANPTLNYHEALLIFNHIVAIVKFIRVVEEQAKTAAKTAATPASEPAGMHEDDIPF
jgi:hypothetical protein